MVGAAAFAGCNGGAAVCSAPEGAGAGVGLAALAALSTSACVIAPCGPVPDRQVIAGHGTEFEQSERRKGLDRSL
jgi:hypothetical protein